MSDIFCIYFAYIQEYVYVLLYIYYLKLQFRSRTVINSSRPQSESNLLTASLWKWSEIQVQMETILRAAASYEDVGQNLASKAEVITDCFAGRGGGC